MNSRKLHAELWRTHMDLKRCCKPFVTRKRKMMEYKRERDDFSLARKWTMSGETAVDKSKEFTSEILVENLSMNVNRFRGYMKKFGASLKAAHEVLKLCIAEHKMRIGKKHPATEKDLGEVKAVNQVPNKLEQFENNLNQRKKIMEKSNNFFVEHNSHLNERETPSEVLKSIRDGNCINDKRNQVRREVLNNRRSKQLEKANLHRGLVMQDDCQAAARSHRIFDLKSLDEALP